MLDELREIEAKIDLEVEEPSEESHAINKDFIEPEEMEVFDVSRPMPMIMKEEIEIVLEDIQEELIP